MSLTRTLNRLEAISEKLANQEDLTKKDLEFFENNINETIRELEIELNWLYDFKQNMDEFYVLKQNRKIN